MMIRRPFVIVWGGVQGLVKLGRWEVTIKPSMVQGFYSTVIDLMQRSAIETNQHHFSVSKACDSRQCDHVMPKAEHNEYGSHVGGSLSWALKVRASRLRRPKSFPRIWPIPSRSETSNCTRQRYNAGPT